MLRRTQKLALGLFIAGFIVVSTGCTSSRLLRSKNDLNLSSDYPAPSSLEVPEAVNSLDAMSGPKKPMTSSNGGSGTKVASSSTPMDVHPQVQSGFYDVPAGSPATPMTAEPSHMYATAPSHMTPTAPAPVVPVAPVATSVATPLPPASEVRQVSHERSIYESEPAYTASAATYDAPLYGTTATTPPTSPIATIAPATATQALPTAFPTPTSTPASVSTPTVQAATYTATNTGTYYQSQANQPRPWRPGSTCDLKTL